MNNNIEKLIIASNNSGKIKEIKEILGGEFDNILSLREAGIDHETLEDGSTFYENAKKKAAEIHELAPDFWVLSDDSGLCVNALGGAPGIFSARFAGEHGNDSMNNALLLEKLSGSDDRTAYYSATVVLISPDGNELSAEGRLYGQIAVSPRGECGFGYDPLFLIPEKGKTVAELSSDEKNKISHRSDALIKLLQLLKSSRNS